MGMNATRLVKRAVPRWAKRRHEAWSTARFVRRLATASSAYLERHDLTVVRGPFAGLEYPPGLATGSGDLVAKLAGTYELELHDVISDWIARGCARIVNVGVAEGFYAVGLARAIPDATVIAYDIDDDMRARCASLAGANGVADRIELRKECTTAHLQAMGEERTVLLCDCEGCEAHLLDPAAAPVLARWEVLVELHDFVDAAISETIRRRFEATHVVTVIDSSSRSNVVPPELEHLSRRQRLVLIGERRPTAMRWARLQPREPIGSG
jgi:hypothetical protein